ncbi:MAG: DUF2284 domain-containing protein [Parasporobacterium sp.]|nr:DUF2284 domain-containing protein [Parasporobacterium sp.]
METAFIIERLAECGFSTVKELDINTLKVLPEVRDMCAVNTCGAYSTRWSCPPGCGSIEECSGKIKHYSLGILVQTVGDIEDSLDWEGIMEVQEQHNRRFEKGTEVLRKLTEKLLPLGSGACTICSSCTYPDAPCRFPDRAVSSMEAFGLFVSDVCSGNGVAYNYGPGKIAYTGCYLFEI